MPFFKSLSADAGPPSIFKKYPDIYGPWSHMSEAMMNATGRMVVQVLSGPTRQMLRRSCGLVAMAHGDPSNMLAFPLVPY